MAEKLIPVTGHICYATKLYIGDTLKFKTFAKCAQFITEDNNYRYCQGINGKCYKTSFNTLKTEEILEKDIPLIK